MIQKIPEGIDSKFRMVLLLARRSEQLMRGARPKLEPEKALKPTRMAAREFEDGLVQWAKGPEGGVLEAAPDDSAAAEVADEEAVG